MGKSKQPESPFPEMNTLLEGMQELLTDEYGNPLAPDHPQFQKFSGLMKHLTETIETKGENSFETPKGNA